MIKGRNSVICEKWKNWDAGWKLERKRIGRLSILLQ